MRGIVAGSFEHTADFGRLAAILMTEFPHCEAMLSSQLKRPLGGKRGKCVAHRRSRYAHPLRDRRFCYALACKQEASNMGYILEVVGWTEGG